MPTFSIVQRVGVLFVCWGLALLIIALIDAVTAKSAFTTLLGAVIGMALGEIFARRRNSSRS